MQTFWNSIQINTAGQSIRVAIRIMFLFAILYTILITAWIGDDAQITFRQIWNFINGDGITFNFGERVQSFTHPLWFLIISVISFITRELFLTTIIISIFFSVSAILVLLWLEYDLNKGKLSILSPIYLLIFSWAYVDYATSGLENALSNFLVSLIFLLIMRTNVQKNIYLIYIILALLVLNRLDYSVLFLPLAILMIFETKSVKHFLFSISIGLVLIISWHLFATVYFGTPFSNTFYAKTNTEFPIIEVISNGWKYIKSVKTDLAIPIILITGLIFSVFSKNRYLISLSLGQILYIGYIINIGGDFMLGRFFTILVFISIGQIICSIPLISSHYSMKFKILLSFSILLCLLNGFIISNFPILSDRDYRPSRVAYFSADERGGNYRFGGLFSNERKTWPELTRFSEKPTSYLTLCSFLGAISNNNSSKYVIDVCGLSDAFIARIPPMKNERWVSGHLPRKLPLGYGEFLIGEISELPDKKLNGLLNDVQLMITGDLFNVERWKSIWRLNTNYNYKIEFTDYTNVNQWIPKSKVIEEVILADWDQKIESDILSPRLIENLKYFNGNLNIISNTPRQASALWFYVDFSYSYDIYVNNELMFSNISQDWSSCNGVILRLPESKSVSSVQFIATALVNYDFSESNRIRYLRLLNENEIETIENQNCTLNWDFKPY